MSTLIRQHEERQDKPQRPEPRQGRLMLESQTAQGPSWIDRMLRRFRASHLRWSIENGRRHVKVLQQSIEKTQNEVESLHQELIACRSEYAGWLAAEAAARRRAMGGLEVEAMTLEDRH